MFEHKAFVSFVEQSAQKGLDIVCLTITQTEGSTYQKMGTTMLVNSDHEMVGVLSGGCIEEALLHCCEEVLKTGHGKLVTHDLRLLDDSKESWEEGVGCNGLIQVWLEPFYAHAHYGILGEALAYAKKGMPMTLKRCLKEGAQRASFEQEQSLHVKTTYDEVTQIFSLPMKPVFKVLILGVGSAVQALIDIANVLGWQTCVCDTRAESLGLLSNADRKVGLSSAKALSEVLREERFDACVIMSHVFKDDSIYLELLMRSKTAYVGLLGSKERTCKIIEFLDESVVLDERFHAPIGLNIGAKTPQAIALAICAQIQSVT